MISVGGITLPTVRPGLELVAGGPAGTGASLEPVTPTPVAGCGCAGKSAGVLLMAGGVVLGLYLLRGLR